MRVKLVILGLVVAGVLYLVLRGDDNEWPIKNDHPSGDVVVAFGDSLTFGAGAKPDESYPAHLSRILGREIINIGVNGDTTATGLARIGGVLSHKPNVVIITLGGNDILRKSPAAETVKNLHQIFGELHGAGAMVVYAAVDPPLVQDSWTTAIHDLCRQDGVLYIASIMKGLWANPDVMSDQIHPNGKGYQVIAERVHARLKEHFP